MRAESAFLSSVLLTRSNGEPLGEDLRDEAAADGRVDELADAGLGVDHADADARVDRDLAVVEGHADFFGDE